MFSDQIAIGEEKSDSIHALEYERPYCERAAILDQQASGMKTGAPTHTNFADMRIVLLHGEWVARESHGSRSIECARKNITG